MLYIALCTHLDKSLDTRHERRILMDRFFIALHHQRANCGRKYKRVDGYKQRRGGEKGEKRESILRFGLAHVHSWIARNISETSWTALTVPFPGQKQAAYWSFKFRITGSEMETCMPLKTAFLVHFSPRDRFSSIPLCPPFEPKPSLSWYSN